MVTAVYRRGGTNPDRTMKQELSSSGRFTLSTSLLRMTRLSRKRNKKAQRYENCRLAMVRMQGSRWSADQERGPKSRVRRGRT